MRNEAKEDHKEDQSPDSENDVSDDLKPESRYFGGYYGCYRPYYGYYGYRGWKLSYIRIQRKCYFICADKWAWYVGDFVFDLPIHAIKYSIDLL